MDERLHRLRAVTQGVIAARKFRRSSSIQGKYVAITPNERDNLEHIQHMTEDITVRSVTARVDFYNDRFRAFFFFQFIFKCFDMQAGKAP